jgi:hypothetical protein
MYSVQCKSKQQTADDPAAALLPRGSTRAAAADQDTVHWPTYGGATGHHMRDSVRRRAQAKRPRHSGAIASPLADCAAAAAAGPANEPTSQDVRARKQSKAQELSSARARCLALEAEVDLLAKEEITLRKKERDQKAAASLARLRASSAAKIAEHKRQTAAIEARLTREMKEQLANRWAALTNLEAQHAVAEETLRRSYDDQEVTTPAGKLLLETPDDVALVIACCLTTPRDLLRLAMSSRRFRLRTVPDPDHSSDAGTAPELWSIVNEAARRLIAGDARVPRRRADSWLGLMSELEVLRAPLAFSCKGKGYKLCNLGREMMRSRRTREEFAVASKVVLRGGRHRARFTLECSQQNFATGEMLCGVLRARVGLNVDKVENPFYEKVSMALARGIDRCSRLQDSGCCMYSTESGLRCPGGKRWQGMESATGLTVAITMELDLGAGTMSVWKNDQRLGVMATGLSGEYVWAAGLFEGTRVRIEHATPMPDPAA